MKNQLFVLIFAFFVTISYSQNPDYNITEFNKWITFETHDDFGDVNDTVNILANRTKNCGDMVYFYEYKDGISMDFYETSKSIKDGINDRVTTPNNKGNKKRLYISIMDAYYLKIKFPNGEVRTYELQARDNGGFHFNEYSVLANVIKINKHENLKFVLYHWNRYAPTEDEREMLLQSFEIN